MPDTKFDLFIPCRKGSKRVKKKNILPFDKDGRSLLEIKLLQVSDLPFVENIIISTDDPQCIEIARKLKETNKLIKIDLRPKNLAQDNTELKDLIRYFGEISESEHIIWTHVTSPFFKSNNYKSAINEYKEFIIDKKEYDSLMSGTFLQKYIFSINENKLLNSSNNYWPPTQSLKDHVLIDSAIFIASRNFYLNSKRIGEKPYIFINDENVGFDIDTQYDFALGKILSN